MASGPRHLPRPRKLRGEKRAAIEHHHARTGMPAIAKALLCAALLPLAGCNYDPRPVPLLQSASAASASESNRHGLWVEPSEIVDCGATVGMAGEVHWNFVAPRGVGGVQIELQAPGSDATTLFAQGGPQGVAPTGPWLRPDLRFRAVDMRDKRVLGVARIRSYPCG